MSEVELYKFVNKNKFIGRIEYHWIDENSDVILFVPIFLIKEFYELIRSVALFDDEGIVCNMKDGYICFKMLEICEHYDIELENVFDKEERK